MKKTFYTFLVSITPFVLQAQAWQTTGNSGIGASNYIGTPDAGNLVFKTNNIERGRIFANSNAWRFGTATNYAKIDSAGKLSFGGNGTYLVGNNKYAFQAVADPNYGLFFNQTNFRYEFRNSTASPVFYINANTGDLNINGITAGRGPVTSIITNTVFGNAALQSNTTGSNSAAIGYKALFSNTTGNYNTAIGSIALQANTIGINNTALGASALSSNTAGNNNTALGFNALLANNLAGFNTAIGSASMIANTAGQKNVAVGDSSLAGNSQGNWNTATGSGSLAFNTTGEYNTAVGGAALYRNQDGSNNTGIGSGALYNVVHGSRNTAIGRDALFSTANSTDNTAVGSAALYNNTFGTDNTAVGQQALTANKEGTFNAALGSYALATNNNGVDNTAIGGMSMLANTDGSYNTAAGRNSLYGNKTGWYNTAIGYNTLPINNNGNSNIAIGQHALYKNISGSSNVAIGDSALFYIDQRSFNIAIGHRALFTAGNNAQQNIGIGLYALNGNSGGDNNVGIGVEALFGASAGNFNTALGYVTLHENFGDYNTATGAGALFLSYGNENSAFGEGALNHNTIGSNNAGMGAWALISNTTGSNNTALGAYADVSIGTINNATAIGSNATVNASNKIQLGSSTTVLASTGGITIVSDGRFKEKVKSEDVPGLDFINQLRPVTYNFNYTQFDNYLKKDNKTATATYLQTEKTDGSNAESKTSGVNKKERPVDAAYQQELSSKTKRRELGFIAQEVDQLVKKNGYTFNGVYTPQNDNDNYALDYGLFVVPLVRSVQQLSKENDSLRSGYTALSQENSSQQQQIQKLQSQMSDMLHAIQQLQVTQQQCCVAGNTSGTSALTEAAGNTQVLLDQNIPNPFAGTTVIGYKLPAVFTQARIVLTDNSGRIIKTIDVSGSGKGSITIDAGNLVSGTLHYTLFINNHQVDSKQMIRIK